MKIDINSIVYWTCTPFGYPKSIKCKGIVTKIKESTFAGRKKGLGISVIVLTKEYTKAYKGRCRTVLSIDKVIL